MKHTMKNLPLCDRPFEKFDEVGSYALSDRELLTILIRSGGEKLRADEIAQYVLEYCGETGLVKLTESNVSDLTALPGIGKVKAIQLLAAAEMAKRIADVRRPVGNHFRTAEDIAEYYLPRLRNLTKEHLMVLILDTKNKVLKEEIVSIGNINTSVCDPRDIFMAVLKANGASVILLHNHPSGDCIPSSADIDITRDLVYAGKILRIPVLDHIILGYDSYSSLRASELVKF